jgi:hypothetical protein
VSKIINIHENTSRLNIYSTYLAALYKRVPAIAAAPTPTATASQVQELFDSLSLAMASIKLQIQIGQQKLLFMQFRSLT